MPPRASGSARYGFYPGIFCSWAAAVLRTLKLASITEIGVVAAAERTWSYGWEGDDLMSIARPDGTELRFVYSDPCHPGFMTRSRLLGADDGDPATPRPERVLGAWEYDDEGNVARAWRGAEEFAFGVDRYELAYDNPGSGSRPAGSGRPTHWIRLSTHWVSEINPLDSDCRPTGSGASIHWVSESTHWIRLANPLDSACRPSGFAVPMH